MQALMLARLVRQLSLSLPSFMQAAEEASSMTCSCERCRQSSKQQLSRQHSGSSWGSSRAQVPDKRAHCRPCQLLAR